MGIRTREVNAQLYALLSWHLAYRLFCFLVSLILFYLSIRKFITKPIVEMERTADTIAAET